MPRSDSGRAVARGGLRDALRTVIQAFRIKEEPLRHETFDWRFPQGPVAPPRRWLCRPQPRCPAQRVRKLLPPTAIPLTPNPSPVLGRGEPILENCDRNQTKRAVVSL